MPRPPLVTRPPLWLRRSVLLVAGAVVVAGAAGIPTVGAAPSRHPGPVATGARGGARTALAPARPSVHTSTAPAPTAAAAPASAPTAAPGGGCPTGSLRWGLSTFTASIDPLDHRQVTVSVAGTVTDDGDAPATVLDAQEVLVTPVVPGATAYPVYLVLDSATLAPGATSRWQGQSPEVGFAPSQLERGHLSVQATWAAAPGCPAPGHTGEP